MSYYFAQGISQSIYDLAGNVIILSLWSEINASPINSVHGGYGIGAMFATQLAKPFIKFNPLEHSSPPSNPVLKYSSNRTVSPLKILKYENTSKLSNETQQRESIDLRAPYWIAGVFSTIIALLFIVSQLYEAKNKHKFEDTRRKFILLNEDSDVETKSIDDHPNDENEEKQSICDSIFKTMQKLLFSDKTYEGKALVYMLAQISLFIISN